MVGPTVDQRAEPVPKIHSIAKHEGPFGGKEMSELQNKEQNKEKKAKLQTAMDRSPKDRHTDSGMIGY
jgi:hypothetical protein